MGCRSSGSSSRADGVSVPQGTDSHALDGFSAPDAVGVGGAFPLLRGVSYVPRFGGRLAAGLEVECELAGDGGVWVLDGLDDGVPVRRRRRWGGAGASVPAFEGGVASAAGSAGPRSAYAR